MKLGALFKMENFNKEGQIKIRGSFSGRWLRKFCSETFYNGYEKFNTNAKNTLSYLLRLFYKIVWALMD
jgi:hypothetical protein